MIGDRSVAGPFLLVLFLATALSTVMATCISGWFASKQSAPAVDLGAGAGGDAEEIAALRRSVARLATQVEALQSSSVQRFEEPVVDVMAQRDGEESEVAEDSAPEAPRGDGRRDDGGRRGRGEAAMTAFRDLRGAEDDVAKLAAARALLEQGGMGQLAAIQALLELSPSEGLEALNAYLASDAATETRGRGFGGGSLSDTLASLFSIEGVDGESQVRELFRTGDERVQLAAAQALAKQGDESLMRTLLGDMSGGLYASNMADRLNAIDKISRSGSGLATEYLTPLLSDGSVEVRLRALDALRRSGDAQLIGQLEAMLNDPIARVRDKAEETIRNLRSPDSGRQTRGAGRGGDAGGRRRGG